MLKFTNLKLGRTASAGSSISASIRTRKDKLSTNQPSCTDDRDDNIKISIRKLQRCQPKKSSSAAALSSMPFHSETKPDPAIKHLALTRSKVSKEELMRLDSDLCKLQERQKSQVLSNKEQSPETEAGKMQASRNRKYPSASFRSTESKKIPVCDDGYFPRVLPISKLFLVKRSNSAEMSKTSMNATTHG